MVEGFVGLMTLVGVLLWIIYQQEKQIKNKVARIIELQREVKKWKYLYENFKD